MEKIIPILTFHFAGAIVSIIICHFTGRIKRAAKYGNDFFNEDFHELVSDILLFCLIFWELVWIDNFLSMIVKGINTFYEGLYKGD